MHVYASISEVISNSDVVHIAAPCSPPVTTHFITYYEALSHISRLSLSWREFMPARNNEAAATQTKRLAVFDQTAGAGEAGPLLPTRVAEHDFINKRGKWQF